MNQIYHKLKIAIFSLIGYLLKVEYFYSVILLKKLKRAEAGKKGENIIVSFTSYGRRVNSCAPFAALSLLKQSVRPEKIILWLDKTKWNDDNLPLRLKRLKSFGLTIMYCEDVRSYTKLLPALKLFPSKYILTVDDDVWYSKDLINNLLKTKQNSENCIVANRIIYPTYSDGVAQEWNSWISENYINRSSKTFDEKRIFALGVGGILYPPRIFDSEIFNKNVFIKKCPYADDIWFYVMAIRNNTLRKFTDTENYYFPLDTFYQLTHSDSSLLSRNRGKNIESLDNNKQLNLLIDYYNIKL